MFNNTLITGSGSYVPEKLIENKHFTNFPFCESDGRIIDKSGAEVIEQFEKITGISERRYVEEQSASDIGTIAASRAIEDAGIDQEKIDLILVAHNFGDVMESTGQSDMVPSIASRIKHNLGIISEDCIPQDVIFGCPGWLQAMIQADNYIKLGEAKTCLVVGTETLSKVVDPFDRDTMIFADGAGAVVVRAGSEETKRGIISHCSKSHTGDEVAYLHLGKSYNGFAETAKCYIKMNGRRIYNYALSRVPEAMATCLKKANIKLKDISKILIHQANEKMDEAIVERLYKMEDIELDMSAIMPMSIAKLGNSSVATIPTLFDLINHQQLADYKFKNGDLLLLASVGAGMNINAMVYKV